MAGTMNKNISRRDFFKLGALALGSLAFSTDTFRQIASPSGQPVYNLFPLPQDELSNAGEKLGRVAYKSISLFQEPNVDSKQIGYKFIDEIFNIYYELSPSSGPEWNPLWYRVWGGYLHSAHIQQVKMHFNKPLESMPKRKHQLCEVTVPFTQIYQFTKEKGWQPKNRLYYETTHWAVGIDEGPDKQPWYRLYDELLETEYHVPAIHLRPVPDEELTPLSPDVSPGDKRIEVSLQWQTLTAYEKGQVVFETRISSGIPSGDIPPTGTTTPAGDWNIFSKMPTKHMGDGLLTGAPDVYTLPGVPWTMFFHPTGVAFHGAYWHNNYGVPMSHGCVNMRPKDAKWLFRWTTPVWSPDDEKFWEKNGNGTAVHVE